MFVSLLRLAKEMNLLRNPLTISFKKLLVGFLEKLTFHNQGFNPSGFDFCIWSEEGIQLHISASQPVVLLHFIAFFPSDYDATSVHFPYGGGCSSRLSILFNWPCVYLCIQHTSYNTYIQLHRIHNC